MLVLMVNVRESIISLGTALALVSAYPTQAAPRMTETAIQVEAPVLRVQHAEGVVEGLTAAGVRLPTCLGLVRKLGLRGSALQMNTVTCIAARVTRFLVLLKEFLLINAQVSLSVKTPTARSAECFLEFANLSSETFHAGVMEAEAAVVAKHVLPILIAVTSEDVP